MPVTLTALLAADISSILNIQKSTRVILFFCISELPTAHDSQNTVAVCSAALLSPLCSKTMKSYYIVGMFQPIVKV